MGGKSRTSGWKSSNIARASQRAIRRDETQNMQMTRVKLEMTREKLAPCRWKYGRLLHLFEIAAPVQQRKIFNLRWALGCLTVVKDVLADGKKCMRLG
jgi:hypothetical protein